ncbi:helix-hairpin-helix domain-containing protein [Bradyrhizobium sp. SZCCHNRI3043]|uniref:helix-hairpin-helix domain-containing protein n=1 Tax=Bradyrhizobium sp. SZCCHNRI3043 TaxID=3057292 RepID=UPI0039658531
MCLTGSGASCRGTSVRSRRFPGLGPKRVKLLYDKLGVRSLEDVRRAIRSGRLRELKGGGVKSEQKLLLNEAPHQLPRRENHQIRLLPVG